MINHKQENKEKNIFNLYVFLFIFNMFNRTFSLFGLDIRYINILLSIYLMFDVLKKKKVTASAIPFSLKLLGVMFIYTFLITIISLSFNDVYSEVQNRQNLNLIILLLYNFISLIIFVAYRSDISLVNVKKSILFAFIISLMGTILTEILFRLGSTDIQILSSEQMIFYGGDQKNFFGSNYRISSWAGDPNFLMLNAFITYYFTLYSDSIIKSKTGKIGLVFSISFIIMLSSSKTLVIAMIIVKIISYLSKNKLLKKHKSLIPLLILIIIFVYFLTPLFFIGKMSGPSMSSRITLWSKSLDLFKYNPLFGSGFGSFRNYMLIYKWPVQAHSTYFQIISELGIVGISIYLLIMSRNVLYLINKNKGYLELYLVYLIWSSTYETMYLPYFIFFNCILIIISANSKSETEDGTIDVVNFSNGLASGGAEKVVLDISTGLARDFNSTLVLTDPTNDSLYLERLNIGDLNLVKFDKKKHAVISNNFRIYNFLTNGNYDVVHTHQITLMYLFLSMLFNGQISYIHTIHSDAQLEFGSKFFRKMYHILFFLFDIKIVSISEHVQKGAYLEYPLVSKSSNYLIYNGSISSEEINLIPKPLISDNEINLVCVGRLVDVKNYDLVFEVVSLLEGKGLDIKLAIYGEGELEATLKEKVVKSGLESSVSFRGVTRDITEALKAHDYFLMCSKFEGLGLAAIEAMSCGLPLILTPFGPANELILNNGFVSSSFDANELSELIQKIIEGSYEYYSINSKTHSLNFTKEKMLEGYERLYKNVVG